MTSSEHPANTGRHPEFARMSLKPGIGAWAMEDVALTIMQHPKLAKQEDVPTSLMHGKRHMPLGRYLRRKLADALGKENNPQNAIDKMVEKLRPLQEAAIANNDGSTPKTLLVKAFKPNNDSLDARLAIHERKKPL